ncbi:ABC transporter ATP-binding protein [Nesterenkonia haasae]|uniref:ABC transporter ATP-binding protein n=1 Tax=Nesterenkonia haasae TaxID=2587813 RepID=UPI0013913598|nr:ABC transporter ATP-binding protein [Nesterenkonia haasae]NDK30609.1 ABC transporter ATP-binding protein [Nesterenkonia haasae]
MLVVDGLAKRYPSFRLKEVSFEVPAGHITGFIGANGAGKTTTLKSIMNIVRPDAGKVTFEGSDLHAHEAEAKQRIGFMLGPVDVYPKHSIRTVVDVYRRFYEDWDDRAFGAFLDRFEIDARKKISELSTGMRVKLGVSMALSHGAKLILLDEPTSGLDPVARDELLDLLQEVVEDGERGVLFSTHITSDLDKCADYIVFIRNGRIIGNDTKDDLIANHVLLKGSTAEYTDDLRGRMIGHKSHAFGFTGLARTDDLGDLDTVGSLHAERPNLETLMLYYDLEGAQ